jgi:8-oxo-dGTP diphosphatase
MTARPLLVNVVLFRLAGETLQVLLSLSKQSCELPGSILGEDEGLEQAAKRAISALLDRRKTYLEQLFTYGDGGSAAIKVAYFAVIPSEARTAADQQVCWAQVSPTPAISPADAEILAYALRRLRYKLEYTAVGFQLLPAEFTLSELQHTYEIILDEKLDKRNFRRRILQSGIIELTPRQRTGEGRPARLYRYRPDAVAEVKARRLFP